MDRVLALLRAKSTRYWPATSTGESILNALARSLEEHFGYTVLYSLRELKRWSRICQKASGILAGDPNCTPDQVAEQIKDIAGGRILVLGLEDLRAAGDQFSAYINSTRPDLELWPLEDHVVKSRPGGFRALSGGVFINASPILDRYPFELQFMTPLQYAWDKLQHPVYEKVRVRGGQLPPPDVAKWFNNLSKRLYKLDKEISKKQESFRSQGLL
jgi:ppGpp synthetase/RelA/SpoT-type nucleotidyltranferase